MLVLSAQQIELPCRHLLAAFSSMSNRFMGIRVKGRNEEFAHVKLSGKKPAFFRRRDKVNMGRKGVYNGKRKLTTQ